MCYLNNSSNVSFSLSTALHSSRILLYFEVMSSSINANLDGDLSFLSKLDDASKSLFPDFSLKDLV